MSFGPVKKMMSMGTFGLLGKKKKKNKPPPAPTPAPAPISAEEQQRIAQDYLVNRSRLG